MNLKLKFIERPFSELLTALEKGEIDVIMSGMTITPERNLKASFAGSYLVSGKSILAKSKRLSDLDEMGEINRTTITVAALNGSTSQKFVEKLIPDVKLVLTEDYESAVKMVLEDKVDIMIADYPVCVLSILRHPDADLATLKEPLTLEPIGMVIRRYSIFFFILAAQPPASFLIKISPFLVVKKRSATASSYTRKMMPSLSLQDESVDYTRSWQRPFCEITH
ncbi:transporter substrate-binding domain-containing protein [candidate division KSB1 bacterium]|nr:transporter substrate-binding domain-containing protein [candidate division KSB1 bacterium]